MIIEKPWGHEEIWAQTESYVGKKIFIKSGHRLSLQYHEKKEETIYILSGRLSLYDGDDSCRILIPGDSFHIPPGEIHRFCASESDVSLMEVSTNHLDDVVRIEDDYKR